MAQTGPSGRIEPIVLAAHAGGDAVLSLSGLTACEARDLGAGFAAIDPWAQYPYPASALETFFATQEPSAPRLGIRSGQSLSGAIGIRYDWFHGPYVQFLGLLPGCQARGTGSRILGWLELDARDRGARNLWVAASDFNSGAIRFYERHGFARVADLDGLVRDGKTEVLFRKRL